MLMVVVVLVKAVLLPGRSRVVGEKEIVKGVARVHERVVAAKEGPKHLERVHGVEGEGPVEALLVMVRTSAAHPRCSSCPVHPASSTGPETILPVAVVRAPLVLVPEHLVRLGDLFKPLLGVLRLVLVRVELERHLPIGLLNVLLRDILPHAQDGVVVLPHHSMHGKNLESGCKMVFTWENFVGTYPETDLISKGK